MSFIMYFTAESMAFGKSSIVVDRIMFTVQYTVYRQIQSDMSMSIIQSTSLARIISSDFLNVNNVTSTYVTSLVYAHIKRADDEVRLRYLFSDGKIK
jgi:hypothetical protein